MRDVANLCVAAVAVVCLIALFLDIYPGVLADLLFVAILFSFVAVPVVGVGAIIVLLVLFWNDKLLKFARATWLQAVVSVLLLGMTYDMLAFYVARRIAFIASRSAFDALLSQVPSSSDRGLPLNRRLGVFQVDEYAADPRGGVYFRVHSGGDGLGPDIMSYGFAYQPNPKGTPFGASEYQTFAIGRGWYWFRASDDSY